MRAQLLSHQFKKFTSPKSGKEYEINEYEFLGNIKGIRKTFRVSVFGVEDKTAQLDAVYEVSGEGYADKDGKLQWGTSISPAAVPVAK